MSGHQGSKSMLSTVDMTFSGKCIASVSVVLVSIMFVSAGHEEKHHLHTTLQVPIM